MAYKPGSAISRFLFYKVLVRLYRLYFAAIKRLGWSGHIKNKSFAFFVNQKLVHAVVGALTIFFVIFNLTQGTQAVSPEEMTGKTFLSEIISSEFGETDQLIEEYFDEEAAITPIQQTYLDNLTAVKVQPMAEMATPGEGAMFEDTVGNVQSGDAIIKPDLAATSKGIRPRENIIDYIVQAGDSVSTIAAQFGISVNSILWENNLSAYSLIRPGNKLVILPMTGVTHSVKRGDTLISIAAKYAVEQNVILEANKLGSAEMLAVGQKLIIPGGRKTATASSQVARSAVSITDLFKPDNLKSIISNKLAWPTVGARITQYYSWAHHAVDIANKKGTPIYACDTGVIEIVGWGTGYGNQIVINHGGGVKSRYGHMSKFYVVKGQAVAKGEVIGLMGSTGNSTGPHLHFEYIINNIKYNPLNYLK